MHVNHSSPFALSCALRCLVAPLPPSKVAMSPHTDARAPSGRSLAEHSARLSAAPSGQGACVYPIHSTFLELPFTRPFYIVKKKKLKKKNTTRTCRATLFIPVHVSGASCRAKSSGSARVDRRRPCHRCFPGVIHRAGSLHSRLHSFIRLSTRRVEKIKASPEV